MHTRLLPLIVLTIQRATALLMISLTVGTASNAVYAVTINFDEISRIPTEDGCFCDHPLTDEYSSQGLLIDGGYLIGESKPDGTNDNQLLGSNFLQLRFIGTLPTFVSMYVNAAFEQAVFLNAYGAGGWTSQHQTAGWAGTEENSTPYVPNQLVSFQSATGISTITLEAFYNLRTGAVIDNLTYEYTAVPAPSSLVLACIGLCGFAWRRQKMSRSLYGKRNINN